MSRATENSCAIAPGCLQSESTVLIWESIRGLTQGADACLISSLLNKDDKLNNASALFLIRPVVKLYDYCRSVMQTC